MALPASNLDELMKVSPPITEIKKNDVARFKDDEGIPRVVADAGNFIVYSLKNRSSLRVLTKRNSAQIVFKQHTAPVEHIQFVNYQSNVVASHSANELCVWYIVDEKEAVLYFTAKLAVRGFSWVFRGKTPDLVLLYGTKVAILKASELLESGEKECDEAKHLEVFSRPIAETASHVCTYEGFIAYSVDETRVVTGTRHSVDAPAWSPCEEKPITHISMASQGILVAACTTHVSLWDVEAEPKPMYQLYMGNMKVCAMGSAGSQIALFFDSQPQSLSAVINIVDTQSAAAKYDAKNYEISFFQTAGKIHPQGFSLSAEDNGMTVLADFGSTLSYNYLFSPHGKKASVPLSATQLATQSAGNGKSVVAPPNALGSSPIQSKVPIRIGGGAPNVGVPPPPQYGMQYAPMSFNPVANTMTNQLQMFQASNMMGQQPASPNLLRNQALGGQGTNTVNAAAEAMAQEVDSMRGELERTFANTAEMSRLVKTMVRRDHEELMKTALSAQLNELQIYLQQNGGALGSQNAVQQVEEEMFYLMQKLSASLSTGVAGAVDENVVSLGRELSLAVTKQTKKDMSGDLKKKLDQALSNAANEFSQQFEVKQKVYTEQQLQRYVGDIVKESMVGVQALQAIIQQQQEQLAAYQNSGLLQEVESLRKEVSRLKQQAGGADAASQPRAGSQPNPQTIVSTAKQFIDGKDYNSGLEWVLRFKNHELTITLLTQVKDELKDELINDGTVSDETMATVVTHLTMNTRVELVDACAWWIEAIVLDRDTVGSTPNVKKSVKAFAQFWKDNKTLSATQLRGLAKLERVIK